MKSINNLKSLDHLKLTKQQMLTLKGGDDDVLLNNSGDLGVLNFTG